MNIKSLFNINLDILKLIALITMTIDHIGHILLPSEYLYRVIGRLSFPLFAFLIATHLVQKGIFKKYLIRFLIFAVISSFLIIPYKIMFFPSFTLNIFWSFLLSVSAIALIEKISKEKIPSFIKYFLFSLTILIPGTLSLLTDYQFEGFIYMLSLYGFLKTKKRILLISCLVFAFLINFSNVSVNPVMATTFATTGFLTTLFLLLQHQPPAKEQLRFIKPWWIFYIYFPVHMVLLFILKIKYFM